MKEKCINCPLLKNHNDKACWSVEHENGIPCRKVDKDSIKFNPKYFKYILEKSEIDTSLPSFIEEVANLAESTAEYIKDGFIKATEAEQKRRMEICESCEMYEQGRCKSCGCYLDVKVRWRISSCPIERWGVEDQQNIQPIIDKPDEIYDCKCGK